MRTPRRRSLIAVALAAIVVVMTPLEAFATTYHPNVTVTFGIVDSAGHQASTTQVFDTNVETYVTSTNPNESKIVTFYDSKHQPYRHLEIAKGEHFVGGYASYISANGKNTSYRSWNGHDRVPVTVPVVWGNVKEMDKLEFVSALLYNPHYRLPEPKGGCTSNVSCGK